MALPNQMLATTPMKTSEKTQLTLLPLKIIIAVNEIALKIKGQPLSTRRQN